MIRRVAMDFKRHQFGDCGAYFGPLLIRGFAEDIRHSDGRSGRTRRHGVHPHVGASSCASCRTTPSAACLLATYMSPPPSGRNEALESVTTIEPRLAARCGRAALQQRMRPRTFTSKIE